MFALPRHLLAAELLVADPIGEEEQNRIVEQVRACLPHAAAWVLSDYAKGVLTAPRCRTLVGLARSSGLPALVDPKGMDFSRYVGATLI